MLVELHIFDTSGDEEYAPLRPLVYPDSDAVLICYAISDPDSLEDVQDKVRDESFLDIQLIYVYSGLAK